MTNLNITGNDSAVTNIMMLNKLEKKQFSYIISFIKSFKIYCVVTNSLANVKRKTDRIL